jgi:hypothetical protein
MRISKLIIASIFIFFSGVSHSFEIYQVGDWSVQLNAHKTAMTATTVNESGNEFGRICYLETRLCGWALLSKTPCKEDVITPVLVNADSGAWHLSVKCTLRGKSGHVLFFTSGEELSRISSSETHLGIAFPLESGNFLVMRFSLNGSDQAVKDMEAAVADAKPTTKDIVL